LRLEIEKECPGFYPSYNPHTEVYI